MKRIFLLLTIVILLVIGGIYIFKSYKIHSPEFVGIRNIELINVTDQSANVKAILVFHNPNTFEAQLLNTQIKVFSNDVFIAEVSQNDLTKIGASQDFDVPFSFSVDLIRLGLSQGLAGLIDQALSTEKKLPLRFEGYCRIRSKNDIFKIPINFEEQIVFQ